MLPKILRFAMDSVLYYCVPMNRRAFTLRPSVVFVIIHFITITIPDTLSVLVPKLWPLRLKDVYLLVDMFLRMDSASRHRTSVKILSFWIELLWLTL